MVSSDDEVEDFPEFVTDYHFEDDKEEPISLAVLPVWSSEAVQESERKIYVRGKIDNGHGNVYKRVKAWKFDISGKSPVVSVLAENNKWIKLQKPRISYGKFSRTVLITVNFLHLVKRNPELHGKDLWDKLSKILRLLDDKPSLNDLIDHKTLIMNVAEHDDSLKKSKYLMMFLEKNLQKKNKDQENSRSKGKDAFIVDDDDLEEGASIDREESSGDEEDGDDDVFDSVCFICDEGGDILCCDGVCGRSFHATREAAKDADSKCKSLGFSSQAVQAMQTFKCQNCQHKQHQCYSCGQLGSSDKESGAAEVFQCANAICGYFFHPGCVAKLLHRGNEDASKALQKDIAAGETFSCPLHVCFVCRLPEDQTDCESRLAVCRRCPRAYHKKCLPREISFEGDDGEGIVPRAWDNLLAGRILIYCLKHEIDESLGTPWRNHIKFPGESKKESQPFIKRVIKSNVESQNKNLSATHSRLGPASKPKSTLQGNHSRKTDIKLSKLECTSDSSKNPFLEMKPDSGKGELKSLDQSDVAKPKIFDKASKKSAVQLDSDSRRRISEVMKEASSKFTLDYVIEQNRRLISSCGYNLIMEPCKEITDHRVNKFCKAVSTATRMLRTGANIEDAKALCRPSHFDLLVKWKGKLRVYLAPFIHGSRYTSFGRHFTKCEKLVEIVDKIHWYVNPNDTIVDFCCGSNEFSLLMREKLTEVGKTCNYKNYDLFRPKDDFSFEKRNWMDVQPKELPDGSQLIIGLNPPFGVRAKRANQFITKALEFKPKLLILIVPKETQRLDRKKSHYDLVWEDREKFKGKSFYLPGFTEKYNNQMDDWNNDPPILYLWSRPDWTAKHKAIANKHCHLRGEIDRGNHANTPRLEQSSEKRLEHVADTKVNDTSAFAEHFKEAPAGENLTAFKDNHKEIQLKGFPENRRVKVNSRKKRHNADIHAKEDAESVRENKRCRSSPFNPHEAWPRQSPFNARGGNLSSSPLRCRRSSPDLDSVDRGQPPFDDTGYGDRRYLHGSQPRGYEPPSHDSFDRPTIYGGIRSEFPIPGSRYDHPAGVHGPPIDVHPGGGWPVDARPHANYPPPPTDYPPRISDEWAPAYLNGSDGHGATHPYTESEQRYRETGYGRVGPMPAMHAYEPRFPGPNHARMDGYDPDPRHPPQHDLYDPRQGYSGIPMGFASRPHGGPFHHPHASSGSGGWIND